MRAEPIGRAGEWAIVVTVAVVLLAVVGARTPTKHPSGFDSDGVFYAAMAEPDAFPARFSRSAPWCWRPLTPWIVSQVPVQTRPAYVGLGVLCNFVSLLLLHSILRRSGLSFRASLLGVVLYGGIFWTLKFSFYSPAYIDFMTQTFLLAILFSTIAGWFWLVPLLLGLGALQKESLLLVAAVPIFEYARRSRDAKRIALYAALCLGIGAATFAAVKMGIEPVNKYGSIASVLRHSEKLTRPDSAPRLLLALYSGLGLLPFFALCDPRGSWQMLRSRPAWLVLLAVAGVLLFGGLDKARLFLYMAPAVSFLAARALEPLLESSDVRILLWIAAGVALHLFIGHHFTAMGSRLEYLNRMVPIHARGSAYLENLMLFVTLSLVWIASGYVLLRGHRRADAVAPGDE